MSDDDVGTARPAQCPAPLPAAETFHLRAMSEADLEVVAELESALFGPEAWSATLLAEELAAAGRPQADRAYVVVEDRGDDRGTAEQAEGESRVDQAAAPRPRRGAVLGYAGIWFGDAGGDADLLTIATAPAARRRGVATALLRDLIERARRRGCAHVLLEVRASNSAAQALYARHGFEALTVRRRYYTSPQEDALVMRLRLAPRRGPGPVGREAVAP